jgi:Mg-chelatase subunit ChlD
MGLTPSAAWEFFVHGSGGWPALPFRFDFLPVWLVVLLWLGLAAPILWLGARASLGMGPVRQWIAITARTLLLLTLVLALAGLRWQRRPTDLDVMVLRDASPSTSLVSGYPGTSLEASIDQFLRDASAPGRKPARDAIGTIRFDQRAVLESLPRETADPGRHAGAIQAPAAGTDIAAALQLGLAAMRPDRLHRLLLISDGNATRGELDAAVGEAASLGVPIDVMPLRYSIRHDVALERLVAPATRREGEPFGLDVTLRSTNDAAVAGTLTIADGADAAGSAVKRRVALRPGLNAFHVPLPGLTVGVHHFHAAFEADPVGAAGAAVDAVLEDNSADAVTFVRGHGRLLYVQGNSGAGDTSPLLAALGRQGMGARLDRVRPEQVPTSPVDLQAYDAVVLDDVPRGAGGLTDAQGAALASYVHDTGGGLAVVGGPNSFGAGGWAGSRLAEVFPVDCNVPASRVMPAGALVLVLDCSGSMSEGVQGSAAPKEAIAGESAILAMRALSAGDLVGVVAFNDAAGWVVPLQANDHPTEAARAVREIVPRGGTDICAGLAAAYDALASVGPDRAAVKHVLLLTDGRSADGDYQGLIDRMRKAHITLSTIGVGDDVDAALLDRLARAGGGAYHAVTDPTRLPQVFIKEARTVRRTLVEEKSFTPVLTRADSPLLAGIRNLPAVHGLVVTSPRHVPQVFTALTNPAGDPLLAHWQAGLGRVAAFTSDDGSRWAGAWAAAPVYDAFWAQVVRGVARPSDATGGFSVAIDDDGDGHGTIRAEAVGESGSYRDFLQVQATLLAPGDGAAPQHVRLLQTGPGAYAGHFDANEPGAYLGVVTYGGPGQARPGTATAALVVDASPEFRSLRSNDELLSRIAGRTGGRVLAPFDAGRAQVFSREHVRPVAASMPVWDWLLVAAVALLLVDVAVRRIAWDRQMVHAAVAHVRSFTTARRPDARPVLASLLKVKERQAEAAAAKLAAKPDASPVTAVTELAEERREPTDGPEGGSTESLLAAKRRARERFGGGGG